MYVFAGNNKEIVFIVVLIELQLLLAGMEVELRVGVFECGLVVGVVLAVGCYEYEVLRI